MAAAGSTRAGRCLSQPAGFRAFMPAPLPPDPPLAFTPELTALLPQADPGAGPARRIGAHAAQPHLFVFMYVRKEAVLSSQIEGTQNSLQDLLAAEARLFDLDLPRDVDEARTTSGR